MGRLYASPWAIGLYEKCPAAYRFAKVSKVQRGPRLDDRVFFSGLVVHQVWEYFCKHGDATYEQLEGWVKRAIDARETTCVLPWQDKAERDATVEGIYRSVRNSFDMLEELGLVIPGGMEAEVQLPGSLVHGIYLTGRTDFIAHVDRKTKKIAIVDWKDGAASGVDYFQMGLYQLAWEAMGYTVVDAVYCKTAQNVAEHSLLTERRRSSIKKRLDAFREGVSSLDFPPKCDERKYRYCDYKTFCADGMIMSEELRESMEGLGQKGEVTI